MTPSWDIRIQRFKSDPYILQLAKQKVYKREIVLSKDTKGKISDSRNTIKRNDIHTLTITSNM